MENLSDIGISSISVPGDSVRSGESRSLNNFAFLSSPGKDSSSVSVSIGESPILCSEILDGRGGGKSAVKVVSASGRLDIPFLGLDLSRRSYIFLSLATKVGIG